MGELGDDFPGRMSLSYVDTLGGAFPVWVLGTGYEESSMYEYSVSGRRSLVGRYEYSGSSKRSLGRMVIDATKVECVFFVRIFLIGWEEGEECLGCEISTHSNKKVLIGHRKVLQRDHFDFQVSRVIIQRK